MYRKYYSYNDMPRIPEIKENNRPKAVEQHTAPVHKHEPERNKILGKFEVDDVLLVVVALVLLMDDCDDKLLLVALGFVFLTGFMD